MPARAENHSRILQDGYERVRNPKGFDKAEYRAAFDAQLRSIHQRDKFPTMSESFANLWKTLKAVWKSENIEEPESSTSASF